MSTRISVSYDLIRAGTPRKSQECPVYLAIRNKVKDDVFVRVLPYSVWIERISIPLPDIAIKFIRIYDKQDGSEVIPIEFELDIPERLLK